MVAGQLVRDASNVSVAALEDEQHPLLAGLEVLDLPEHFLDIALGSLGVQPGQPALLQLVFQGLQVDHGTSKTFEEWLHDCRSSRFVLQMFLSLQLRSATFSRVALFS
jgi:hypothetical protein